MIDANSIKGYLSGGKLTVLPSKRKKKLAVLVWLAEHIPADRRYSEREFNELLNKLHTFSDPATLRRELCDFSLVCRSPDGAVYRLDPERPSYEELLERYCGEKSEKMILTFAHPGREGETVELSDRDLEDAADFRNRIHAEALGRVQQITPDIDDVVDRYPPESYFQQMWDYPGKWYTIVAVPESAGSREALIDTIVRDTIAAHR